MTNDIPAPSRLTVRDANDLLVFIGSLLTVCVWCWRKAIRECVRWLWNCLLAPNNIARIMDVLAAHDLAIKTTLARSRITWNSVKSPIWESDPNGMCVFANSAFLNLVQRRESEILGNAWESIVHEDDRERVTEEWRDAVSGNRDFNLHYRWVGGDGTVFHVHAQANRLIDESGVVMGWVSFVEVVDVDGFKKGHNT